MVSTKTVYKTDNQKFLELFSGDGNSKTLVYFIPGNPGIVSCYEPIVTEICSNLSCNGVVASHLGHTDRSNRSFNVEESWKGHQAELESRIPSYDRVFILGHSIGCYFALQAYHHLPSAMQSKVQRLLMIAPVISQFGPQPLLSLQVLTTSLVSRLIMSIAKLEMLKGLFPSQELRSDVLGGNFGQAIVDLCKSEFKALTLDPLSNIVTACGDKFAAICPANDMYVSSLTRQKLALAVTLGSPSTPPAVQSTQTPFTTSNLLTAPLSPSHANLAIKGAAPDAPTGFLGALRQAVLRFAGLLCRDGAPGEALGTAEERAAQTGRWVVVEGMPHAFVLEETPNQAVAEMSIRLLKNGNFF